MKLFADENFLSPSVTSIKTENFDAETFRKLIKDKYDILLAGGQDNLKGKIFRIGHLGYVNDKDIISVISAVGLTLIQESKISVEALGEALKKAQIILNQ